MVESLPKNGFLRSIFGFGKAGAERPTVESTQALSPVNPPVAEALKAAPASPSASLTRQTFLRQGSGRQTDAYKNRKKGRKEHKDSLNDLKRIIACIQSHGVVTPGLLAKELGMARSTLTYNLNRFLAYSPDYEITKKNYWENHLMHYLMGQKQIERKGAGPSLRYRLVDVPKNTGSPMELAYPNPSAELGTGQPRPKAPAQGENPPAGGLPGGGQSNG